MMQVTWNETKENGGKTILLHVWALRCFISQLKTNRYYPFLFLWLLPNVFCFQALKTILCLRLTEAFDKDLDLRNF